MFVHVFCPWLTLGVAFGSNKKGAAFSDAEPWGYHAPKQNTGKRAPWRVPRMGYCFVD